MNAIVNDFGQVEKVGDLNLLSQPEMQPAPTMVVRVPPVVRCCIAYLGFRLVLLLCMGDTCQAVPLMRRPAVCSLGHTLAQAGLKRGRG